MYCPRCELKYRPSRVQCSECGFDFSRSDITAREQDDAAIAVVFEGGLCDANTAQAAVQNAGINCTLVQRKHRGSIVHSAVTEVCVSIDDEDAAIEALADGDTQAELRA